MRTELEVLQELVDIVPGAPLRRTDRARFLQTLGLGAYGSGINADGASPAAEKKARILRAISNAAYEMPLPPRWAEQVDVRGYVYFSNALRTEATWAHPLQPAFVETLRFAGGIADRDCTLGEAAAAVREHLRELQGRASAALKDWTGPHTAEGGGDEFFYNEAKDESTWESPLEVWQYELHARYWLLVQLLQQLHEQHPGAPAPPPPPAAEPEDELDRAQAAPPERKVGIAGIPGSIGKPLAPALASPHTPRFHSFSAASSSSAADFIALALGDNASTFLEDTLSAGGYSAAVRSHASEIAASLASNAPSFSAEARLPVSSPDNREPKKGGPAPLDASEGSVEAIPQPPRPRPPPKPPPPLRHLAAPPRMNDLMPQTVLRTPSPLVAVRPSPSPAPSNSSVPPPPPRFAFVTP